MAVNQDSEVTGKTTIDEKDGMGTTCFIGVEIEKDVPPVGELPPETTVDRWVADSGCSQFMTPSADYMVNYCEGGGAVRIADGRTMPIEGIGNLPMSFWSGKDWVQVLLPNVAHVPSLGYNLLSLKRIADRGHKYVGEKKVVALHLKNGKTLFGSSVEKLNYFSGFRRPLGLSSFALATIAPGKIPSVSPVDINTFHTSHGHVHEKLLRSTAKQLGVVLEGSLRECEGSSVAIGFGKPIGRTTSTRADKVFGRLFVDICGTKSVESIGGKRYMLLICDDFSRFTWTYFMRQKSDAVTLFEQFLADERVAGIPSAVEVVRSDEGGEFRGDFAKLCRRHNIRQEFTTADSAKFNGVAERHIVRIESAGMAAQVQAKLLFRGFKIPSGSRLWSARNYWACYALNRTATSANVVDKSHFEMRFGTVPQSPIPFLKPGYVKIKRQDKLRSKALPCFFIGPSANRPRDIYEVLLNFGSVVHSRNVTWARLPPLVPVSAENVHSVSVSRMGGKLDPSRHGKVKVYEDVNRDESSEYTGVRPRVTARLVAPTPAVIPCWRAAPVGGRGTATATSLRGAAMRKIPGTPVHSSAGTTGGFAMSTSSAASAGVNASRGTASPGALAESSPSVSEEDEMNDSPSPKLGGRAAHELRWLGKTSVVRQGRTRGEQRQFDLDSAALIVEEALATEELQEWLSVSIMHDCLTGIDGLYNPLLLGAVNDSEDLAASAMDFALSMWLNPLLDLAASAMDFALSMWLNPLLDSGNGCGAVISEGAFAAAGVGCSKFPHVSKIEDPPMSFADVERSQYQDVWDDSDYSEFSGLWNSDAFRRLKKGELPKNANIVTGKWVRNWKTDDRGNVIKPKSRMVARGFGQIHNVDFSETFAPTPSTASVKIAVAVANEKGWLLRHLDVKQAFIQAHLDEAVYMRLPAGCGDTSGEVVLLQRAVYGLRQAGRQWSLRLSRVLLQTTGMEQSKADPCVP